MKRFKIKQFALSLLAILSLFAASVSACACSHHQENAETNSPSCHEHSSPTKAENNHETDLPETTATVISEAGCFCPQIAPKVVAKSETVKFEKHLAAALIVNPVEILFVPPAVRVKFYFTKPLYLSDSFYNLSPGRAPPVS